MKKIIVGFLVVFILVVTVAFFGRNVFARYIIVDGIKKTCGLSVNIKSLNIGLPNVSISGLTIYNPSGYQDRILADIPEISVMFDLPAFFKNQVHLGKLKIAVKELNVILDEKGKLNVNSLALLLPPKGTGKPPEIKIDELAVKIDKVAYKGYLPVVGTKSQEFDPKIDETFHNVTNPSQVTAEILQKILSRVGVNNFANFAAPGSTQKAMQEVGTAAQETVDKAKGVLNGIFQK